MDGTWLALGVVGLAAVAGALRGRELNPRSSSGWKIDSLLRVMSRSEVKAMAVEDVQAVYHSDGWEAALEYVEAIPDPEFREAGRRALRSLTED